MSFTMGKEQSLYIPCYNCEKQILRVLSSIDTDLLLSLNKIIVIDNSSQDRTVVAIQNFVSKHFELAQKFILIEHKKNYGLGASFKTAVAHASTSKQSYMYWFHGDDQASTDDLKKMIDFVSKTSPPVLFGARFMAGKKLQGYSIVRRIGNKILNLIFSFALRHFIYELGSGLNAYQVSSLPLHEIKKWPNHIAFDIQLLFYFCAEGRKPNFFPIRWREEDQTSNAKNISTGLILLKELLYFKLNKKLPSENIINQEYVISDFTHGYRLCVQKTEKKTKG